MEPLMVMLFVIFSFTSYHGHQALEAQETGVQCHVEVEHVVTDSNS